MKEEHGSEVKQWNDNCTDLTKQLDEKRAEIEQLNEELEKQKEANTRAPTTTMKNMIERLKNQVALKEKQQQVPIYASLLSWHSPTELCN